MNMGGNATGGESGEVFRVSKRRSLWFFQLLEKLLQSGRITDVQFKEPEEEGFAEGEATLTLEEELRFIPSKGRFLNTPVLPAGSIIKLKVSQGSNEQLWNIAIAYWVQHPEDYLFGKVSISLNQEGSLIDYSGRVDKLLSPEGPIHRLGEGIPSFILRIIEEMKRP